MQEDDLFLDKELRDQDVLKQLANNDEHASINSARSLGRKSNNKSMIR